MSDTPETEKLNGRLDYSLTDAYLLMTQHARKLERERDDLRAIFPKILEALESGACAATCSVDFLREIPREVKLVRQRLERERNELRAGLLIMISAADSVVERWETPLWKDAKPTATFIHALRDAVDKMKGVIK